MNPFVCDFAAELSFVKDLGNLCCGFGVGYAWNEHFVFWSESVYGRAKRAELKGMYSFGLWSRLIVLIIYKCRYNTTKLTCESFVSKGW